MHHLAFALDVLGIELRRDEELRETVERALEVVLVDVEEIVRVGERRVGIVAAAVRRCCLRCLAWGSA